MKKVILVIIALTLILLVSYMAISQESTSNILKTFIIENNKENTETSYTNLNTYTIPQEPSGYFNLINTYKQTQPARQRNIKYQQIDEEIEKCIKKITKNWKRTYYKTSYNKYYDDEENEWLHDEGSPFYEREREFYGYDEDEDWSLYWRLRNRALNGEKIC